MQPRGIPQFSRDSIEKSTTSKVVCHIIPSKWYCDRIYWYSRHRLSGIQYSYGDEWKIWLFFSTGRIGKSHFHTLPNGKNVKSAISPIFHAGLRFSWKMSSYWKLSIEQILMKNVKSQEDFVRNVKILEVKLFIASSKHYWPSSLEGRFKKTLTGSEENIQDKPRIK